MSDTVRVLRVIQYEGEREWVEAQVGNSIHGKVTLPRGTITAVTVDMFPQVIDQAVEDESKYRRENIGRRSPGMISGMRDVEAAKQSPSDRTKGPQNVTFG